MRLEWERLSLLAERPFRISRSTEERIERVWVRVSEGELEGWGEAAPEEYYGETADSVAAALEAMRPLLEGGRAPEELERLEMGLVEAAAPDASARAAVVAALHDLVGKRLGAPLWRVWGLDPADAPPSSFTLGIDDPEVMAEKARAARGWPILKVKLGLEDPGLEREILGAVRSEVPGATLRVDANGGWSPEDAPERVGRLAEAGVEFVEQPLSPGEREGLRRLKEGAPIPIVLDESCLVASDVPGLVGLCDGVNVKLAKCGGPREALRVIHAARACGLKVMLGCMLESTLGIAPAAHLAPLADWADLDGGALLAEDPFTGPGPVRPEGPPPEEAEGGGRSHGATPAAPGEGGAPAGRIALGDEPGLGVARA